MVKTECPICGWEGTAPIREEIKSGTKMEIADCPKCGASLYCRTMNGDE